MEHQFKYLPGSPKDAKKNKYSIYFNIGLENGCISKFFHHETEIFLNESKNKSVKISSFTSSLEEICILFKFITKDSNLQPISTIVLYETQWLKFIKKEKLLTRKIINKKEQNSKKKIFVMNEITVSARPVDGKRGLVIGHSNGDKFELNQQEHHRRDEIWRAQLRCHICGFRIYKPLDLICQGCHRPRQTTRLRVRNCLVTL